MKRLLLIINPSAGQKKANRHLVELITLFETNGYENVVYTTTCQGDGTRIVQEHGANADLIVCVGGDGTFNEVVTGVLRSGLKTPMGYIPAGSTNDFASSLNIPKGIMNAAEAIVAGTEKHYDIGRFGARYFSYVASFGAFTKTSYETPQYIKNALGHIAYVLAGIRDIPNIRKLHVRMETEYESFEGDYIFGAISNSTSVGGILTLDPGVVDMNDGLFEILLVRSPKDVLELNECIRALAAQDYTSYMLTFCSASRIKVFADPEMSWTLDGEREEGHDVIEVENIRDAITLRMKH